ncbi:MAG TPA: isochorismatase family cysteine hydrolase [Stellaceae bacterium]|jgi:ureidoacrylate peracid hydrolase|nr:isochorismatase family cysteine hydrolase [Stellaceae bacterium]
MHKIEIPPEIGARAMRARGREHVVDAIDPARTAHIIVDLQNGFMAEGAPLEVPTAREIVPNVNRIAAALRAAGGFNVFLRFTVDPEERQPWTVFFDTYLGPRLSAIHRDAFTRGAPYWQLWPELDLRPGDLVIDRTRFSAFVPGTCALQEKLQSQRIDTLIVTGTLTNVCCEATARDAMQRNYRVVFVTDGNAAKSDFEHNATLTNLAVVFADLRNAAETVALIEASRTHAAAE